jgi:hypothetical protein
MTGMIDEILVLPERMVLLHSCYLAEGWLIGVAWVLLSLTVTLHMVFFSVCGGPWKNESHIHGSHSSFFYECLFSSML